MLDDATYAELSGAQAECIGEGAAEAEQRACAICLDKPADYMCLPCGHQCGCQDCLAQIGRTGNGSCPICRTRTNAVQRVFR